ncbi:MAG: type VI secretion system membrane subunit TssM [Planctomycetota bacterium]
MRTSCLNLVALAVLVALIWFGGEYFELPVTYRVIAISVVLALWLIVFVIQRVLLIRNANLIERRLREQAEEQIASSRPVDREQLAELEQRFKQAIHALKGSKQGKGALVQLPWYMIIGPPGSGKSTALQESGLDFPAAAKGINHLQGLGGTRNCEWWFTSEGILIDTAGRYTTEAEDREEWIRFLDLIMRTRKSNPINGAIVAISVADLVQGSAEEIEKHTKAVRARLDELCTKLKVVFPVYLMFTKCDLLGGFSDFFEDMSREDRGQVWGYTFPFETLSVDAYRATLRQELAALYERLCRRRLELYAVEREGVKKQRVFSFPLQFAMARQKIEDFVATVFKENPFEEAPILRGVYLTSGTQEGQPIDQVLGALRDAYGLTAAEAGQAPPTVEKRSYFITRLFREVIFGDAELARSLTSTQKRNRLFRMLLAITVVIATIVLLVLLGTSYLWNRALVGQVAAGVDAVVEERKRETAPPERLKALEQLRYPVAKLSDYTDGWPPFQMRWGLYQGSTLNEPARKLYLKELREVLLLPCLKALEHEMSQFVEGNKLSELKQEYKVKSDQELFEELYLLLRAYQWLTDRIKSAEDLEKEREPLGKQLRDKNRWLAGLSPEQRAADDVRDLAFKQLDFTLSQLDKAYEWVTEKDFNEALVAKVRAKLENNYWTSQAYTAIRDARKDELDSQSLESLLGQPGLKAFATDHTVSDVFSEKEWNDYFEPAVREKSKDLEVKFKELNKDKSAGEIQDELKDHFEREGNRRWRGLIDDLHVNTFQGIDDAAEKLGVLASDATPLPKLFKEVWLRQYVLNSAEESPKLTQRETDKLKLPEGQEVPPWQDQFRASCERLAAAFAELGKEAAGKRLYAEALADRLNRRVDPFRTVLKEEELTLLEVVVPQVPASQETYARKLFRDLLDNCAQALVREATAEANEAWKTTVQAVYAEHIAGRYPLDESASTEVPLEELTRLLKPKGGAVWTAQTGITRLAEYKLTEDVRLVKPGSRYTKFLESATRLRDALFPPDGEDFGVPMKVKLIKRSKVRNLRFTLGETSFKESDNPPNFLVGVTWKRGEGGARLSLLASGETEWANKDYGNSAWGLVRLLREGKLDTGRSSQRNFRYSWDFKIGEAERAADVEFEVPRDGMRPLFLGELFDKLSSPAETVPE